MGLKFNLIGEDRRRYFELAGKNYPRHTSYPGAPYWSSEPDQESVEKIYKIAGHRNRFSLYVHVPFCQSLCFYCGCTRDIVKNPNLAEQKSLKWLNGLESEITAKATVWGKPKVFQVHLGGGTPTFLTLAHLEKLLKLLESEFDFAKNAEKSIELDPRVTSFEQIELLAKYGFNRVSLGVQDFDVRVQKAVNRIQSFEMVRDLTDASRRLGFKVNFDLICGLPFQTLESIESNIDKVLSLSPDRIAWYRFAMIPDLFKWQKGFQKNDLPDGEKLLDMNLLAINKFSKDGYYFIGLDHFAKREDTLTKAMLNGNITRNFQGMSVGSDLDIIGLGPSAISQFSEGFIQNPKSIDRWAECYQNESAMYQLSPICKLDKDDKIRAYIIKHLYCYGYVDVNRIEKKFGINFKSYFCFELDELKDFDQKGMIEIDDQTVSLSRVSGRLLVRAVASVFDKYFNQVNHGLANPRFSRIG